MSTVYEKIRSIQDEYFLLLDQHFVSERSGIQVSLENIGQIHDKAYEIAKQGPLISFEGRDMPALTYKAILLIREIHAFWRQYRTLLYESVAQIPHLALHAKSSFQTLLDEVRSTALYVDTVVADDWLFSMREMLEDRDRPHQGDLGVNVLVEYVYLQALRQLALADVVPPILIICPSPHYADDELRKVSKRISEWLTLQYATQLFGRSFNNLIEVLEYTSIIRDDHHLATKISDPSLIWEQGQSLESKLKHKLAVAEGGLNISGFPPELASSSPGSSLIIHEMAGFDVLAQQQVDNEILQLDPRVSPYHWEGYLWTLSQRKTDTEQNSRFREETAVARILEQPDISWLGNIPTEKLLDMRAQSQMEEMRCLFRDANDRLKYTSPEKFSILATEVSSNLQEALLTHERELRSRTAKDVWGLGVSIGAFIVNGTLSLASVAIPWLAIPAAAIGLGAGLGSVRDVIRRVQRLRKYKSESTARPIGILWDAYSQRAR